MESIIIVALPASQDEVNKVSSEKLAHLTLLYLDKNSVDDLEELVLFVKHAASTFWPFFLSVDRRDELGADNADVLFFEKTYGQLKRVEEFRHNLLLNDTIRKAYDAAEQYPEWLPHLTLGYPETPANDVDGIDRIYNVHFDRIAVFTGEYEGPEFRLTEGELMEATLSMSDLSTAERGKEAVSEIFHYGKKGMKWGVRNDEEDGSASPSGTRSLSLTEAENKADPNGSNRRELVKKAALIAGGTALVAGVAYGAYRINQGKPSDTTSKSDPKKVEKVIQPPTSIIHLARAKNKGLTFHKKGDTPDFFSVFDKLGLNGDVPNNHFFKDSDGTVAARFLDPDGRYDFAGRKITHDVVVPPSLSRSMKTIDDVVSEVWPVLKDDYQKFWDENLQHDDGGPGTSERGLTAVNELFHYGTKGMKWGVRKDKGHEGERVKNSKLAKLDKKWEEENTGVHGWVKVNNAVADRMNNGLIDKFNDEPRWKKAADDGTLLDDNHPETKAYFEAFDKLSNKVWSEETVKLGSNPSGSKAYEMREDEDGTPYGYLAPVKKAIKHAEGDVESVLKIVRDKTGLVTGLEQVEVELKHYGTKGMKWGVRKDEGASRGGASKGPTATVVTQKKPGSFAKSSGGKRNPIHEDAEKSLHSRQKAKSSTTDALSNAELKTAITRMQLEKQFRDLEFANDRRSRGQRFISGFFGVRRPLKYMDMQEQDGEDTRKKVSAAIKNAVEALKEK